MPTICLDCRYLGPRPSGIGRLVQALVDHLPTLAPQVHFRLLKNAAHPGTLSRADNVTEVPVRFAANGPVSMWLLPQATKLGEVDLFHAPSNILPRGLRMKCVTTIHDLMWLDSPELCNSDPWGRVERRFYRHGIGRALRRSDAILAVSDATRNAILGHDPGLAERTFTARPGVGAPFQPLTPDRALLARWGIANRPFVLTVGQSAPYKNHENALRGFAHAFAGRADTMLVLVRRRGTDEGAMERLAEALGIADRVRILPPVDEDALAQLYAGALALLHPSYCEGFGLPLVEAMASGCPVVTSNLSAMPEVTGGAALLVDPHDVAAIGGALRRVAGDADLRADLRRRGLARAQALRWEQFARDNLAVYRRVLAGL